MKKIETDGYNSKKKRDHEVDPVNAAGLIQYKQEKQLHDPGIAGFGNSNAGDQVTVDKTELEIAGIAKVKNDKTIFFSLVMVILMILIMVFFTSCSQKSAFLHSPVIPIFAAPAAIIK